jgi:hypothetical protein
MANSHNIETTHFLIHYADKIEDILSMTSGNHAPDSVKLSEWIEAQASPRRRETAKILASNIRYIPHSETIQHCKSLITKMYNDPEKPIPVENTLKWFVGPKSKSAYFISILCYHFAKIAGYRLPEVIMTEFDYDDCINSTIFYLDDMSYSGSQIVQLLMKIYETAALKSPERINRKKRVNLNVIKPEPSDIRVGVCILTERAKNVLETFNYGGLTIADVYSKKPIANPYKRYVSEIIPDLQNVLDPQTYTDCLIYFNPYRDTPCICYFEHKLADSNSTFLNVLRFGIVPPTDINYKFIYQHEERKWSKYKPYYNQNKDICDKQIERTQFIPFINDCQSIDPDFIEKLKALPYHVFMLVEKGTKDEDGKNLEYGYYQINTSHNEALFEYKNSVEKRCPHSWYKNAYFAGGTKKGKKRNQRRTKKARK